MKRTWLVWTLVGGVVVTVLVAFNYERGKETVPLTEIFPDQQGLNTDVEYEFFDTDEKGSAPATITQNKSVAPVAPPPAAVSAKPLASAKKVPANVTKNSPPASAPAVAATPTPSAGSGKIFTIQVAAFKERSKADIAVQQAQKKGYPAYVDERSRNDGSVWYQICVGKFDTQGPAKELLTKIKQDYKDGYIKVLTGQ